MIFDDHKVPRRTLEEIETEANRCRSYAELDADGRIDLNQLLSSLRIKLVVKSDREMGDSEAYSDAAAGQIVCRRRISFDLRFDKPDARHVIAHELGHFFLHRGSAPKPRKVGGNKILPFIAEDESAEAQAWKFARALLITHDDLRSGETDEDLATRIGLPTVAVALRRKEVEKAFKAKQPKTVPPSVAAFLEKAHRSSAVVGNATGKRDAWALTAQVKGEDPAKVRSARGFRVEWDAYELYNSEVGWTVCNGEVRALMDLRSR